MLQGPLGRNGEAQGTLPVKQKHALLCIFFFLAVRPCYSHHSHQLQCPTLICHIGCQPGPGHRCLWCLSVQDWLSLAVGSEGTYRCVFLLDAPLLLASNKQECFLVHISSQSLFHDTLPPVHQDSGDYRLGAVQGLLAHPGFLLPIHSRFVARRQGRFPLASVLA